MNFRYYDIRYLSWFLNINTIMFGMLAADKKRQNKMNSRYSATYIVHA